MSGRGTGGAASPQAPKVWIFSVVTSARLCSALQAALSIVRATANKPAFVSGLSALYRNAACRAIPTFRPLTAHRLGQFHNRQN
jgi:hypothetical protein